jgi:four helix bundle protein
VNYVKDIKEWTVEFAILMIKFSEELKKSNVDYDVISQIRRSGTSIGANVREAKASSSRKELIRFYDIALRSANETDFWIQVIAKGYNFESKKLEEVKNELNQIEKVIAKIIVNLKKEVKAKVA